MENIERKGEIACYKQFFLFRQHFLHYMALIFHFKSTLKCRLQFASIWTSLKCSHSGNEIRIHIVRQPNSDFSLNLVLRYIQIVLGVLSSLDLLVEELDWQRITAIGELEIFNMASKMAA